jgi:hypothetical protein
MIESDSASANIVSSQVVPAGDNLHDYPISREGRRQAIVLLLGVISLWVFALWSLINILQDGISGTEWVSLLLMLGIVLVAPVVGWALLEEAGSRITTGENGIRYHSIGGIDISYKWEDLAGSQPTGRMGKVTRFFLGDDKVETSSDSSELEADRDDVEPDTRLFHTPDRTVQITNPMARILHKLSYGASLPLYGGIERRDDLLIEIASHLSESPGSLEDDGRQTTDDGR